MIEAEVVVVVVERTVGTVAGPGFFPEGPGFFPEGSTGVVGAVAGALDRGVTIVLVVLLDVIETEYHRCLTTSSPTRAKQATTRMTRSFFMRRTIPDQSEKPRWEHWLAMDLRVANAPLVLPVSI